MSKSHTQLTTLGMPADYSVPRTLASHALTQQLRASSANRRIYGRGDEIPRVFVPPSRPQTSPGPYYLYPENRAVFKDRFARSGLAPLRNTKQPQMPPIGKAAGGSRPSSRGALPSMPVLAAPERPSTANADSMPSALTGVRSDAAAAAPQGRGAPVRPAKPAPQRPPPPAAPVQEAEPLPSSRTPPPRPVPASASKVTEQEIARARTALQDKIAERYANMHLAFQVRPTSRKKNHERRGARACETKALESCATRHPSPPDTTSLRGSSAHAPCCHAGARVCVGSAV
eukprot:7377921-Prymnesium_polylepis.2